MIQRIQSIYLLLASAAAFLLLRFPYYYVAAPNYIEINGAGQYSTLIELAFSASVSLIAIFLFSNRMLQLRIVIANFLLTCSLGCFIYKIISEHPGGGFTIFAIALVAIPIFQVLAAIRIIKDERLVKQTDRLR